MSRPHQLPEPETSAEAARRAADEVLADRVFARPAPSLLERARDWVLDRIGEVFDSLFGTGQGVVVGWVLVAVLALGAVVLAVRFGRGVRRSGAAGDGTGTGPRRPAVDWLADAERLEAAGDHRGGLRCRHRALVAELAARGVVEEVPGRTTGEYRRLVAAAAPGRAAAFDEATTSFEAAWYGARPAGPETTARFRALAADVLDADRLAAGGREVAV